MSTEEPKDSSTNQNRRRLVWAGAALFVVLVLGYMYVPIIVNFARAGFFDKKEDRVYVGDVESNLKALYRGMMLYHDSEEHFPESSGWMDAIKKRIQAGDMTEEEANKKLINPRARPAGPDVFGFAMNDAASGKYKDDLKDPRKTILVFESSDTKRNAHGNPESLTPKSTKTGHNLGITVNGEIVKY